ncbi:hypothetical protein niasHT_018342 [Heterodera trifolii]|uniref:Uncharacterized protein n=1 Tax=Heterodera trifolii TaxID=157864 RepID=A0ABD2L304_9BILA
MSQKLLTLFIVLCALSLYTDAVKPSIRRTTSSVNSKNAKNKEAKTEKQLNRSLSLTPRKRSLALTSAEADEYMTGELTDKEGKKPNPAAQNIEQPATPEIVENMEVDVEAVAEAEAEAEVELDPKGRVQQLLEMGESLKWELAVQSDNEQLLDLDDDLEVFPRLIFLQLAKFLKNAPAELNKQQKKELKKVLVNWMEEQKQPFTVDEERAQVDETVQSLSTFCDQIGKSFKATPAILDIFLDFRKNETHETEKLEFMWKMVNRKVTRYVKSVGQFYGGIKIAKENLKQVKKIGKWAKKNQFISDDELENLEHIVERTEEHLVFLQKRMAQKLGINLDKFEVDKLAKDYPSLSNHFITNLQNAFAQSNAVVKNENVQADEAQIGTGLLVVALSVAASEIDELKTELLYIELTWKTFHSVGQVTKMSNVLEQIQGL